MKFVFIFLDGVGIGKKQPEVNPFFHVELPILRALLGGNIPHLKQRKYSAKFAELFPLDANMGVAGFPQSGTGQTAIYTGVNAAQVLGRHFGPYPTTDLKIILEEKSIFKILKDAGKRVCFANAFPRQFFEYANNPKNKLSATSYTCKKINIRLRDANDLKMNKGISADITRARWAELGYPEITPISARNAGLHLAELSKENDFTLFEYWLPDHVGHERNMEKAVEVLNNFDSFLGGYYDNVDHKTTFTMITSDHGNIEDLSVKTHTRNPVPCIVFGPMRKIIASRMKSIIDITPVIKEMLL